MIGSFAPGGPRLRVFSFPPPHLSPGRVPGFVFLRPAMNTKVTCGTVGSGTDEDPYQAYAMSLWPYCSGLDQREDPTAGVGPWIVELIRPDHMSAAEYDVAMADILADPAVTPVS